MIVLVTGSINQCRLLLETVPRAKLVCSESYWLLGSMHATAPPQSLQAHLHFFTLAKMLQVHHSALHRSLPT